MTKPLISHMPLRRSDVTRIVEKHPTFVEDACAALGWTQEQFFSDVDNGMLRGSLLDNAGVAQMVQMVDTPDSTIFYDPLCCKFGAWDEAAQDMEVRFSTFVEAQMYVKGYALFLNGDIDGPSHLYTRTIAQMLRTATADLPAIPAQHRAISNAIERLEALA